MHFSPEALGNIVLTLMALGVVGVLGMNVQLWKLTERVANLIREFNKHETECDTKHGEHYREDRRLWDALANLGRSKRRDANSD